MAFFYSQNHEQLIFSNELYNRHSLIASSPIILRSPEPKCYVSNEEVSISSPQSWTQHYNNQIEYANLLQSKIYYNNLSLNEPFESKMNSPGANKNLDCSKEEDGAANILLSIRHSSTTLSPTSGQFDFQSAIAQENLPLIPATARQKRNRFSSKSIKLKSKAKNNATIRSFPKSMPLRLKEFPRWYCRFGIPSLMSNETRKQVFGVAGQKDAKKIKDNVLRAAFDRSFHSFGTFKEPKSLFNLYSPRIVRGIGRKKEALCPICFEQGQTRFLKSKTSAYNYHMIHLHGISPVTHQPFYPPIAFKSSVCMRQKMLKGQCHCCKRWINLLSKQFDQVKVAEIYWWKHAKNCHKACKGIEAVNPSNVFINDEFFKRVKTIEELKNH